MFQSHQLLVLHLDRSTHTVKKFNLQPLLYLLTALKCLMLKDACRGVKNETCKQTQRKNAQNETK